MASLQEAISRLTVETVYRTAGAAQAANDARQVDVAQGNLALSAAKVETATGRMEQALLKSQRALQLTNQASQQLVGANDNVSRSMQAANDNSEGFGKSIIDAGSGILAATGHIKLLALAAYTLSPAFRSFANAGLVTSLAAIGPAAASAAGTILSALAPALAFLARITVPILAIVAVWQLLNAIIKTGSDLLEKYGNAQRNLVSGVDDNLAKLTKFQDGNLSAEQVQRATELGARLNEAKKTISDFLGVQLDLNNAGMATQAVWVRIVELIAAAVDKLNNLPPWAVSMMLGAATGAAVGSVIPGVGTLVGGAAGAAAGLAANLTGGGSPSSNPQTTQNALVIARQRLAAGMGSTSNFANRFGQAVNDLADPKKAEDVKKLVSEFDRLELSLQRQAAMQEAEALAVGASVGEHARLRTEMRLQEAALQDIEKHGGKIEDYADRIKKLADRYGEAAQRAAELKLQNDLAFERSQIGRTQDEQDVASRLRGVYGNGYEQQMDGAIAAQMRFNQQLKLTHDLGKDAFKGFISDIRAGKSATEALQNALQKMLDKLLDRLLDNVWEAAWSSVLGGSRGGGGFLSSILGSMGGGAGGVDPMGNANGNAFDGGNVIPFARGGIVTRPTLFPMANGMGLMGEAGPEAVMPLRRGTDGRLGVQAANNNRPTVIQQRIVINSYNAEVEQTTNDDSGDFELTVRGLSRDENASGRMNSINRQKYGLSPRLKAR